MKSIISLLLMSKQALSSGWSYDYMTEWSNEYSMCATLDQSPIDIQSSSAVVDDSVCSANFDWNIDFSKQNFKITNNGHSIVLHPIEELAQELGDDEESNYLSLTLNENTIAKFPNYFAEGDSNQEYCLDGLHFHWGTLDTTGSEHLVNGEQFPLEVHFVHYSCDHDSVGTTLGQFPDKSDVVTAESKGIDTHQLGVVGIFFDIVDDRINPAFEAMFGNNETFHNIMLPGHAEQFVNDLDLSQIVPDHVNTQGYYAYKGSLTTPPCTDIVNWHVMKARSYIGRSQIEKFRQLMSTETYAIAPNYREVQDNENTVYSCEDANIITKTIFETESETSYIVIAAIVSFLVAGIIVGVGSYFIYNKNKQQLIEEINSANKRSHLASISGGSNVNQQYGQTNV